MIIIISINSETTVFSTYHYLCNTWEMIEWKLVLQNNVHSMFEHVSKIFIKLWRQSFDRSYKYSHSILSKSSQGTSWLMATRTYMSRDHLTLFLLNFQKTKTKQKTKHVKRLLETLFFLALLILFSASIIWWRHVLDACQDDMSYLYWNYLSLKIFYNLKKNVISEKTLSAYSSINIVYVLNECDSNKNFNPTP